MIVSVKYHGPTNHMGSRWSADLEAPSNHWSESPACKSYTLRSYSSFDYGDDPSSGALKAVMSVLNKWEDMAQITIQDKTRKGEWIAKFIGQTHDHIHIWQGKWVYAEGDE
tara:strand:- start:136 stop:468 length:333 start_codon:yes stop_codon:yes gene_type:complete